MNVKNLFVGSLFLIVSLTGYTQSKNNFFNSSNELFQKHVVNGRVDYKSLKGDGKLESLITEISNTDASKLSPLEKKAFYINAYNLLVINAIAKDYPINSPMDITGFFDGVKHKIAGEKKTLDEVENKILRPTYDDSRFHFVLVCGAVGCPPIINKAYFPETLDKQMEKQARLAINNNFINVDVANKTVEVSEIMKWYKEDFTSKSQTEIDYINKYRTVKIPEDFKLRYSKYNWALNEQSINVNSENISDKILPVGAGGTNLQTYTPGSLLKKGKIDLTLFNSVYTQDKSNWLGTDFTGFRETFVTSLLQFTYGTSKSARINFGVDVSIKSNARSTDSSYSSITDPLDFSNTDSSRFGITNVAFKVRIAPFKGNNDFSLQSSISIPTISNPEGFFDANNSDNNRYWADWDRIVWWNQFFYTKSLGTKFQLFTEADLLFRFAKNDGQVSALDMPVSVFFSYFPAKKVTLYAMTQYVPRFPYDTNPDETTDFVKYAVDYTVAGAGFKYQLSKKLQLELLYTKFVAGTNSGLGESFNIGIKFLN